MRRRLLLIATLTAVVALLLCGCGSPGPQAWVSPVAKVPRPAQTHRFAAGATNPFYAETLHWAGVSIAGRTGYFVYVNGTQRADVTSSPYVVTNLACATTYTLSVRAHDAATPTPNTSAALVVSYTTPGCGGLQTLNCFTALTACGYPAPATVGSTTPCASLTTLTAGNVPAGWSITGTELTPTGSGTSGAPITLTGFNVSNYWIYIGSSSYIKLVNDCITVAGSVVPTGDSTVWQQSGTNLTVDHVTMIPAGCSAAYNDTSCSSSSSWQYNIGYGANSSITNSVLADAEENLNGGSNVTISGNYINANGVIAGQNHTENLYVTCSQGIVVTGNTLLNPWDQTANLYADTTTCGGGCTNQLDVENNLIAGGGEPMNWCPNASTNSTGTLIFKNNDLARCAGASTSDGSGHYCAGGLDPPLNTPAGSSIGAGQDTHGYYPLVGYFGVDAGMLGCPSPAVNWTGDFYDDTGASVTC